MSETTTWPWAVLFLLGAYHAINPGMGWLFAVALGMQEKSSRAVWRALEPITAGHALAIGLVVALAGLVQAVLPRIHLSSEWRLSFLLSGSIVCFATAIRATEACRLDSAISPSGRF